MEMLNRTGILPFEIDSACIYTNKTARTKAELKRRKHLNININLNDFNFIITAMSCFTKKLCFFSQEKEFLLENYHNDVKRLPSEIRNYRYCDSTDVVVVFLD